VTCSAPQSLAAISAVLLSAVFGSSLAQDAAAPALEGYTAVQDLQIVDCLLPGQVRVVGGRTYLTPRRPARTSAADCRNRGGEYLAYDRANYRAALNVWLAAAEGGDPEAQTNVGEIYERSLGEPDYVAAADWYRKAADKQYTRAQYNLGALYERGLGVPADPLEALNWYRRSWGLTEDSLIWQTAAAAEQSKLRTELEARIAQQDKEIAALREQVETLSRAREAAGQAASAELDVLRGLVARLSQSRDADVAQLQRLPPPKTVSSQAGDFRQPESRTYRQRDFGRFFALIIGVQDYDKYEHLSSPLNDVQRVQRVLEERYGFSVKTLPNPTHLGIMSAVNEFNCDEKDSDDYCLEDDDNLLIYFAGRGSRLRSGMTETGYWLPVNADQPPNDTLWVPNDFITRHLGRIQAKRILVVSDSSYSDLLASEPGLLMVGEGTYGDDYIEYKLRKRSRLLLASGGDEPVVDADSSEHSVFARALLDVLEGSDQVLTAPELFLRIRERIAVGSNRGTTRKEPDLKAIKAAGHEVGDFFFVPG
jgi:uncharacterized protein